MKLERLELYNFKSHKSSVIDFSNITLASICGNNGVDGSSNGSGKSSIVEAILWAIFGTASLPNKDLVRQGANGDMSVDLTFTSDGHQYVINRSYDDAMRVKATIDGQSLGSGSSAIAAAIEKWLGVSKDVLYESVIISQGQLSSFIHATPSERRDLIITILGLGKYNNAWNVAKESLRTMQNTTESYNTTVSMMQDQINKIPEHVDLDAQIIAMTKANEQANKKHFELSAKKELLILQNKEANEGLIKFTAEAESINRNIESTTIDFARNINKIETVIKSTDQQIGEMGALNSMIPNLESQLEQSVQAVERLKELKNSIQQYEADIQKKRSNILIAIAADEVCPVCQSVIGKEKFQSIVKDMQDEVTGIAMVLDMASREVKGVKLPDSPDNIRSKISYNKERIVKLQTMQEARPALIEQLDQLKKQRDALLQDLQERMKQALDQIGVLKSQVNVELVVVTQEIDAIQRTQIANANRLVEVTSFKQSREKLENALTDAKNNLELFRSKIPETKFVVDAVAPSGIPLMIIDHYLPQIESRSQELLRDLSNGTLSMKIEVVDSGSKKGIELYGGSDAMRPIKSLSGGEQTRVSLALRIALSQILSQIAGVKFDLLVLDEPDALDAAGFNQLIRAINALRTQYPQILVISHNEQLKGAFPSVINVIKTGTVSEVSVS